MTTATITRSKLAPTPGKNYRAAWRWLYKVDYGLVLPQVGAQTASFDSLGAARRACLRNGFKPVEIWQ